MTPNAPRKVAAHPPSWGRTALREASGALANFNRGLVIGDEVAAGLGTAVSAFGDLFGGRQSIPAALATLGDRFKAQMATQRAIEDDFATRRPITAKGAQTLGGATLMAGGMAAGGATAAGEAYGALRGAQQALAPTTRVARVLSHPRVLNAAQGAITADATASTAALGDRGTLSERIRAAARETINPFNLTFGAALGPWAKPRPSRAPGDIEPHAELGDLASYGDTRNMTAREFEAMLDHAQAAERRAGAQIAAEQAVRDAVQQGDPWARARAIFAARQAAGAGAGSGRGAYDED